MTNELRAKHIEFIQKGINERCEGLFDISFFAALYFFRVKKQDTKRKTTIKYSAAVSVTESNKVRKITM